EIEQTFSRVYGSHCDAGIGLPKTSFRSSSTSFLGVSSFDPPLSDFLSAPLSAVLSEVLSEDLSEDLSEVLSLEAMGPGLLSPEPGSSTISRTVTTAATAATTPTGNTHPGIPDLVFRFLRRSVVWSRPTRSRATNSERTGRVSSAWDRLFFGA